LSIVYIKDFDDDDDDDDATTDLYENTRSATAQV